MRGIRPVFPAILYRPSPTNKPLVQPRERGWKKGEWGSFANPAYMPGRIPLRGDPVNGASPALMRDLRRVIVDNQPAVIELAHDE